MKNLMLVISVIISINSSYGFVQLFCGTDENFFGDDNNQNHHVLLKESVQMDCSTLKFNKDTVTGLDVKDDYRVTISGIGLGFRVADSEIATIICPTVRKKSLGVEEFLTKKGKVKKGIKDFYGLKIAGGALAIGGDLGIFGNEKFGTCTLTGIQVFTVGVGVSGAKMTIVKMD